MKSRSVDGYAILNRGEGFAVVEIHSDEYKLPVVLYLSTRTNVGVSFLKDTLNAMEVEL